ncbi:unnamed protein product [Eruca vesicaria subsp. sativa]|uniref:Uncharacterized protein n=1 Tax=Eruca vesicaria subsp. sativa TaxID=29727 RepID=A0ABC8LPF2_ERUVS|nr:unnamed protein product [Eruca vesicaria subsp. sativa]
MQPVTKFHDLAELFRIGGMCPDTKYLFMGDYVDRGYYSVETVNCMRVICIIISIVLVSLFPRCYMCVKTILYFLYLPCLSLCLLIFQTYDYFACNIVLILLIQKYLFCLHGGLSPSIETLHNVRNFDRVQDQCVAYYGLIDPDDG